MGLRDDIQADLAEALADADGLLDVVTTFDFVTLGARSYDNATDSYQQPETLSPCKGIFKKVNERQVDHVNVLIHDEIVMVNGSDALVEPKSDMIIRLGNGQEYRIIEPGKVPGGSAQAIVWKMQVRKNG